MPEPTLLYLDLNARVLCSEMGGAGLGWAGEWVGLGGVGVGVGWGLGLGLGWGWGLWKICGVAWGVNWGWSVSGFGLGWVGHIRRPRHHAFHFGHGKPLDVHWPHVDAQGALCPDFSQSLRQGYI